MSALISTSEYFTRRSESEGKRARTRAAIMDAALKVFARDGYQAAAIRTIAHEAGLANGTFYLYFKTKEDLILELGVAMANDINLKVKQAVGDISQADKRVCQATQHYIRIVCEDMSWGLAFFKMYWFLPDIRQKVASNLRTDVEYGIAQGVFKVDIDELLIDSLQAITRSAIFANLSDNNTNETAYASRAAKASRMQIRLLGVPPARAKALTPQAKY